MIQTSKTPIEVQYTSDTPELTEALKAKVEQRLQKLVKRHHDVTGVALAVETTEGPPRSYRVRLALARRPENVVATDESPSLQGALKEVLDAVERQVRERRDRQHARSRNRRRPGEE